MADLNTNSFNPLDPPVGSVVRRYWITNDEPVFVQFTRSTLNPNACSVLDRKLGVTYELDKSLAEHYISHGQAREVPDPEAAGAEAAGAAGDPADLALGEESNPGEALDRAIHAPEPRKRGKKPSGKEVPPDTNDE